MIKKINNFTNKHYKKIHRTYIVFLVMQLILALGYDTEYANPRIKTFNNKAGVPFYNDAQSASQILFWCGAVSAIILFFVYNFKVNYKKGMNIYATICRMAIGFTSLVFAILAIVVSIPLHATFESDVAPFANKDVYTTTAPPTAATFYISYIFGAMLFIVALIYIYSTFMYFKSNNSEGDSYEKK